MSRQPEAVVIGASPNGLIAAAYLARAGLRVTVVEAASELGGSSAGSLKLENFTVPAGHDTLYALDPNVVRDLKLPLHGLGFAVRDLDLVSLRSDGEPLQIGRDVHDNERRIAALSQRDSVRFADFRRDLFSFARAMRAIWWEEGAVCGPDVVAEQRRLSVSGADAFLDAVFEADALKAALLFDAMANGMAPSAAGSALVLAWRAAQEMCGLQGAVAIPNGGVVGLVDALQKAVQAAGVTTVADAKVVRLQLVGDAVTGVVLASGEEIYARVVLSSLSRRRSLLDFAPAGAAGFAAVPLLRRSQDVGEAKLALLLNAPPSFANRPARYIIIDRLEGCVAAHAEARNGRIPSELSLELVVPSAGDPSWEATRRHLLSIHIRPLPVLCAQEWSAHASALAEAVIKIVERHSPGLRQSILAQELALPHTPGCDPMSTAHILSDWRTRIATPVEGLFLCGETAEPVPAVSGRAARIAAAMAAARLKGRVS